MSTWHPDNATRHDGEADPLYHPTQWTVVENLPKSTRVVSIWPDHASAREHLHRVLARTGRTGGGVYILPPSGRWPTDSTVVGSTTADSTAADSTGMEGGL